MLKRVSISSEISTQWTSKRFLAWQDIVKVELLRPKKKKSSLDYVVVLHSNSAAPLQIMIRGHTDAMAPHEVHRRFK